MEIRGHATTVTLTLPSGEKVTVPLVVERNTFGGPTIKVADAEVPFDNDGRASDPEEEHLCNLCGLSYMLVEGKQRPQPGGLIRQSVSGGYASAPGNGVGALDDGATYQFNLCEFCLDWLFSRCQVPPKMGTYMTSHRPFFQPAEVRVREDEWRKQKDEFFAAKARHDEARARPIPGPNPLQSLALRLYAKYDVQLAPPKKGESLWHLRASNTDANEPYETRTAHVGWSGGEVFTVVYDREDENDGDEPIEGAEETYAAVCGWLR